MNKAMDTCMYNLKKSMVITAKELKSYIASPILYILLTAFLLYTGIFYFWDFYATGRADMRFFFTLLPFVFTFFIPAITMKQFAEERNTGTLEMIITMPVTTGDIVFGKFLASLAVVCIMLVPTLFYVVSLGTAASPDFGMIVGGYVGSVLLAALYVSVGIFASSLTHNQIIAWLLAFAICIFFTTVDFVVQFVPGKIFSILSYLSASVHFKNIAKGVLDFRDITFLVTVTVLFLILSAQSIDERR
ncbi:MAG: ABC transporter permease subunit [Spirochaetota bacterium]